jgi:ADP-ribose pyrophosphatase YjhB (NUDIX family)
MIEENGKVVGCGIMTIANGMILLGRRTDGQGWSCSGGKVEQDETIMDGAIRETREEFGIEATDVRFLGRIESTAKVHGEPRNVISHMFVANTFKGKPTPQLSEMAELKWFDLNKIDESILFEPTKCALRLFKQLTNNLD